MVEAAHFGSTSLLAAVMPVGVDPRAPRPSSSTTPASDGGRRHIRRGANNA
jgi:hypothetical protein